MLGPRAYALAVRRPPRNASPLLRLRLDLGLSRRELSRRTGISYNILCNVELGHTGIAADNAQVLADFYGVPVAEIHPRSAAA